MPYTDPLKPKYPPRGAPGATGLPGTTGRNPSPWGVATMPKPQTQTPVPGIGDLSTGLRYNPRGSNPTVPNTRPTPDLSPLTRMTGLGSPSRNAGGFAGVTPQGGGATQPGIGLNTPSWPNPGTVPAGSPAGGPGGQGLPDLGIGISPKAYAPWQSPGTVNPAAPTPETVGVRPYVPREQVAAPVETAPTTPPVDPTAPKTEHGRIYDQKVLDALQGNSADVRVARDRQDRDSARRLYQARRMAEEQALQAGYQPGTVQFTRLVDSLLSQANQANLAGEQSVGDLSRAVTKDAMGQALGVEERTYGRGITERTYQDTKGVQKRGRENELIDSVEDPKLKYHLRSIQAAGGNVEEAYNAAVENGTIRPEYRSQSPVADIKTEAEEWVRLTQPELAPGSAEFNAAVTGRMKEIDAAKRKPLQDAGNQTTQQDIAGKLRLGQPLTKAEEQEAIKSGLIPQMAVNTVPKGKHVAEFLKRNPHGKIVIDGQVYTLLRGEAPRTGHGMTTIQERHTDIAVLVDAQGNTKYIYGDKIHDQPPKTVSNDLTPWGF